MGKSDPASGPSPSSNLETVSPPDHATGTGVDNSWGWTGCPALTLIRPLHVLGTGATVTRAKAGARLPVSPQSVRILYLSCPLSFPPNPE